MAIFNKCHALCFGFLIYIIVPVVGYTINQGDYSQHEYIFIGVKSLLLFLSFAYAKWFEMLTVERLSKKQVLLVLEIFLLSVLVTFGYFSFFSVSSGAATQHLEETSRGLSLSFIISVIVLGPIQEEFMFRGILQGAVFDNSWLGLALTSTVFSFLHAPYDVPSFLYYMIGGLLLGFAYKKSQNLLVSILVHMCFNAFPLIVFFINQMIGR